MNRYRTGMLRDDVTTKEITDFIRTLLTKARSEERKVAYQKIEWPTEMMSHNKYDVIVRCQEAVKKVLLSKE